MSYFASQPIRKSKNNRGTPLNDYLDKILRGQPINYEAFLKKLAKLSSITLLAAGDEAPLSATALVGELEVLVPMAGLIDKTAELARLDKEIQRLEGEVKRIGGKLGNAGFVDKAPPAVIDKERGKLADAEKALTQLSEQRSHIASL